MIEQNLLIEQNWDMGTGICIRQKLWIKYIFGLFKINILKTTNFQ